MNNYAWNTDRYKHALALHDRSTAAKEANDKNENASHNTQHRCSEEADVGYDWCVASLGHLQPNANAKDGTAQQLSTNTKTHTKPTTEV